MNENLQSNLPTNNPVVLTLAEYIQLLWDSAPKIISQRDYIIIGEDRKHKIESVTNWNLVVVIEPLEQTEIQELKNLGVIHVENKSNQWFKLTKVDVWMTAYKAEIARKLVQQEEIKILIERENRIKDAIGKLIQSLGVNYQTAHLMMTNYILKGQMMDVAKLLEIEDLVKKLN